MGNFRGAAAARKWNTELEKHINNYQYVYEYIGTSMYVQSKAGIVLMARRKNVGEMGSMSAVHTGCINVGTNWE